MSGMRVHPVVDQGISAFRGAVKELEQGFDDIVLGRFDTAALAVGNARLELGAGTEAIEQMFAETGRKLGPWAATLESLRKGVDELEDLTRSVYDRGAKGELGTADFMPSMWKHTAQAQDGMTALRNFIDPDPIGIGIK
jgi:phage terminase large subunit-like protein